MATIELEEAAEYYLKPSITSANTKRRLGDAACSPSLRLVKLADYRDDLHDPSLNMDESMQVRLVMRAQNGDERACETLYSNLIEIIMAKAGKLGDGLYDLGVEAGIDALGHCIKHYDPNYGAMFTTYFFHRLNGAMVDVFRTFGHDNGKYRYDQDKLKARQDYEERRLKKDRFPTDDSTDSEDSLVQLDKETALPERLQIYLVDGTIINYHVSLEDLLKKHPEKEPASPIDIFEDTVANIKAKQHKEKLRAAIEKLPEPHRTGILFRTYSIIGDPAYSVKKAGERLGIHQTSLSIFISQAMDNLAILIGNDGTPMVEYKTRPTVEKYEKICQGSFMDRIRERLEELEEEPLEDEDVEDILIHLRDGQARSWTQEEVVKNGQTYKILKRKITPNTPKNSFNTTGFITSRRAVGVKDGSIIILVKDIRASDLRVALDLEKSLTAFQPGEAT